MKKLLDILNFQKLLKKYNGVYRDLSSIHNSKESDNDIEHSYRVAMLCWFIVEKYKLKLKISKILKYALVHDLVEVYAGDVSIYKNTPKKVKSAKEHKSFQKLQKQFPHLEDMWSTISKYEKRTDAESKFVYIIEKLEPIFVVILSEQDHWIKRNVSIDDFIDRKQSKIKDISSFAQMFNKETMDYLQKNKHKFFKK
ncbi:MAG: hypothetical protein RL641_390 [Candidatus Parcubacteria bacterium]|jgi:putative hydrolase of HD superfamily